MAVLKWLAAGGALVCGAVWYVAVGCGVWCCGVWGFGVWGCGVWTLGLWCQALWGFGVSG